MNHLDSTTLNLYLDDALDHAARKKVDTHLASCQACQRELDAMRALLTAFEMWRAEPIPGDVTPAVLVRIADRLSPAALARWSAVLLTAQLVAGVLILTWVMPFVLERVKVLPFSGLPTFNPDPLARVFAVANLISLPFPTAALWVWVLALAIIALVWLVGNRLILKNVERTEAPQ